MGVKVDNKVESFTYSILIKTPSINALYSNSDGLSQPSQYRLNGWRGNKLSISSMTQFPFFGNGLVVIVIDEDI